MLTYSVMGGIGGALMNSPSYGAIAHFFMVRRGFATGLASTAGGIGGMVFPLLLQHLLGPNGVGFGWGVRILGFILLGLCILANVFIRSRLHSRMGPDGRPKAKWVWPDLTIFRNRGYAVTALGIFFMEWGLFIPLTYVVSYAKSHGRTEQDGAILLAILNAGSVVGRFLPGFIADKLGRFNVIIVAIFGCAVSVIGKNRSLPSPPDPSPISSLRLRRLWSLKKGRF
jgi:MFS family permease